MRYCLFFFSLHFSVFGQADERITFAIQHATLEEALTKFSRQTGYAFSYSDDIVPLQAIINVDIRAKPLNEALKELLSGVSLDFRITRRRIILQKPIPSLSQTIRGMVKEHGSGIPLPGVSVVIANSDPLIGAVTDEKGNFRIDGVPVGRASIQFTSVGYESYTENSVLLGTGKELILDVSLVESVTSMSEIEVVAHKEDSVQKEFRDPKGRTFSLEETRRFPATFADPARMATSFAGVTSSSDENNGLIVRGNSPRGVLWRINGIEVPNPNHFAAEGSSSGVISVLSSNILDRSTFLKGAFSAPYGNALSAVLDLNLRNGNNERREHSFQAGMLGMEASTEGPFSKKGGASYLLNYRYSTLRILDQVGVALDDIGKYSNYQDLAFNLNAPMSHGGQLNLFGIAGKSTSDKLLDGGRDNDASDIAITGLNYRTLLSRNMLLSGSVSWSGTKILNDRRIRPTDDQSVHLSEIYRKQYYKGAVSLGHRINDYLLLNSGIIYTRLGYDFYLKNHDTGNPVYEEILNFRDKGNTSISQAFVSADQRLSEKLRATYGAHYLKFHLTNDYAIEPRASLQWHINQAQSLTFSYGKHSRIENLQYYIARDHQEGGDEVQVNKDLGFTRANHFGVAYERKVSGTILKGEMYYQGLSNVPVNSDDYSFYSSINEDSGFITDTLYNRGTGKNYGVELSLERLMKNEYYFLFNLSLYQSKFGVGERNETSTSYNGNYIFQFVTGREKRVKGNHLAGLNLKTVLVGGKPYVPIDVPQSVSRGYQVMDWDKAYDVRLPVYFRVDLQLSYKLNRERYSVEWRLDIQNLTHHRNAAYYYFDASAKQAKLKQQVGFIPLLTYRIEF